MKNENKSVSAIIAAGGTGSRMRAGINKMFLPVSNKPIICRTLDIFESCGLISEIVLVTGSADIERMRALTSGYKKISCIVPGGASRRESVYNGLRRCKGAYVCIHDGARALLDPTDAERVINDAFLYGAAALGVPCTDTLKTVSNGFIEGTIDRSRTYAIQTPQVFRRAELLRLHELAADEPETEFTDDCSVAERRGVRIKITEGSYDNIKITAPGDIAVAERILSGADRYGQNGAGQGGTMRIGQGYDVHRLTEGRPLILCGVNIPHTMGLDGHSDADAAVHALIDAMLGAAALGDIGKLFPDSDPKYRGISSILLLKHVTALLRENSYTLGNADITIAAQRPKLAPYIGRMRENIAAAAGVPAERISVKATTTERLGFEGREEGISASAAVIITYAKMSAAPEAPGAVKGRRSVF